MTVQLRLGIIRGQSSNVRLKDIERPRRSTPRGGIDEDYAVIATQDSARQIEAADAEIDRAGAVGQWLLGLRLFLQQYARGLRLLRIRFLRGASQLRFRKRMAAGRCRLLGFRLLLWRRPGHL